MFVGAINPVRNYRALGEVIRGIWNYRELTLAIAKRDIFSQYAGQSLGAVWAIGHPLFLMALYLFIFSVVFKVKIGGTYAMPGDYITYILSGLVPWLGVQAALSRACGAFTGRANLVKQVVFPIEVLPLTATLVSVVPQVVGIIVLIVYIALHNALSWMILLLPIVFLLQICGLLGMAFVLAGVSVFFKDLKEFVLLFLTAGIYLVPIVYLPSWVPKIFAPFIYVNPFSYLIWCYQDIFYFGRFEHPIAWVIFAISSLLSLAGGYRIFVILRSHLGGYL